jgi:hypothetical protein
VLTFLPRGVASDGARWVTGVWEDIAHHKGSDRLVPSILRNEYRSALLERVSSIAQRVNSAAFQNMKGFVHPQVSEDRNTRTDRLAGTVCTWPMADMFLIACDIRLRSWGRFPMPLFLHYLSSKWAM